MRLTAATPSGDIYGNPDHRGSIGCPPTRDVSGTRGTTIAAIPTGFGLRRPLVGYAPGLPCSEGGHAHDPRRTAYHDGLRRVVRRRPPALRGERRGACWRARHHHGRREG